MPGHAQKLRIYFLALDKHLLPRNLELEVKWSRAQVIDWMKTFRLPPFEQALPVRAAGGGCGRCLKQESQPQVRTERVFPNGARMRCDGCGAVWLEAASVEKEVGQ